MILALTILLISSPDPPAAPPLPDLGRLFLRLDRDGDGRLSPAEVPEGKRELFEQLVRRSDRSGDGQLTAEELRTALFLEKFVADITWAHFDIMAYNIRSRPGRPEGGEAMGVRAVYHYLQARFGG